MADTFHSWLEPGHTFMWPFQVQITVGTHRSMVLISTSIYLGGWVWILNLSPSSCSQNGHNSNHLNPPPPYQTKLVLQIIPCSHDFSRQVFKRLYCHPPPTAALIQALFTEGARLAAHRWQTPFIVGWNLATPSCGPSRFKSPLEPIAPWC